MKYKYSLFIIIVVICFFLAILICCCKYNDKKKDSIEVVNNSDSNNKIEVIIDNTSIEEDKKLIININSSSYVIFWLDNEIVKNFKNIIDESLIYNTDIYLDIARTLDLTLDFDINSDNIDVVIGDIVLLNDNKIAIFYEDSSGCYIKLGHINVQKNELKDLLTEDIVVVSFNYLDE